MNITVYLGANLGTDPALPQAVQQLGRWIGESGNALVYGGSKSGLMGLLADSVLAAGGRVTGVEPKCFLDAPSILYDLNGYYQPLHQLLQQMITMGLSTPARQQNIAFAADLAQIRAILEK